MESIRVNPVKISRHREFEEEKSFLREAMVEKINEVTNIIYLSRQEPKQDEEIAEATRRLDRLTKEVIARTQRCKTMAIELAKDDVLELLSDHHLQTQDIANALAAATDVASSAENKALERSARFGEIVKSIFDTSCELLAQEAGDTKDMSAQVEAALSLAYLDQMAADSVNTYLDSVFCAEREFLFMEMKNPSLQPSTNPATQSKKPATQSKSFTESLDGPGGDALLF